MKHAFTLFFGLAVVLTTIQAQGRKQETIPSPYGSVSYYATVTNANLIPTTQVIVSNPHSGIFVVDSGNGNYNCHAFALAS